MTQFYRHTHSFLKCSFPFLLSHEVGYNLMCYAVQLAIHSKRNCLHLPTPNSQSIPLPPHPQFPLASTNLISMPGSSFLFSELSYLRLAF